MNDTAFWDSRRNRIRTRKGGWRIGRGISVHGHSLLGDLVGSHGFFDVLYLEVTGRLPDPRLAQWIEASFLCLAFPDPRIWCNQIGALAGSSRIPPTVGISAGVMASESTLYGPGSTRAAHDFSCPPRRRSMRAPASRPSSPAAHAPGGECGLRVSAARSRRAMIASTPCGIWDTNSGSGTEPTCGLLRISTHACAPAAMPA